MLAYTPRQFHDDYYACVNHVIYLGYCNKAYASIVGQLSLPERPTRLSCQRPLELTLTRMSPG